jgi:hypothetical protein
VRELRLHIDEQLTTPVEHRCANPSGNTQLNICELRALLLFCKSLPFVVVGFRFQAQNGTKGVHFGSVVCRACPSTSEQIESPKEKHIMSQSRGAVSFEPLFTAEDIGLRKEANVEHVMKVFITVGEGVASRWIEMPKGVLLLQIVPDNPASGAIYLYDRELQVFYFVVFDEGRDDSLTPAEFDDLVTEYNLVSWTAHPALLRRAVGKPGTA